MSDLIENKPDSPVPELVPEIPPVPGLSDRTGWCLPAAIGGIAATLSLLLTVMTGLSLVRRFYPGWIDLTSHPLLLLWLGVLPLHVGALVTVLGILAWMIPPGERVTELELKVPVSFLPFLPFVLGAILVLYPLNALLILLTQNVMQSMGWPLTEPAILELLRNSHGVLFWGSAIVIVVGLAAVAEEILFRKVLHDAVARFLPQQAMLVTALIFALTHGVPEQMLPLILLSVVLQMSRRRFHSLWPAIFLHGAYNAISLSLLKLGIEWGL